MLVDFKIMPEDSVGFVHSEQKTNVVNTEQI